MSADVEARAPQAPEVEDAGRQPGSGDPVRHAVHGRGRVVTRFGSHLAVDFDALGRRVVKVEDLEIVDELYRDLIPIPPFADPEDWRQSGAWRYDNEFQALKVREWVADASADHLTRHQVYTHPWCVTCERRSWGEAAADDAESLEYEESHAELAALRRALRYLLLYGRRPAPIEPPAELPEMHHLDEFLDDPDEAVTHRVAGLWPTGGRIVLAAPAKAGKTTAVGNLIRALADGTPFLDHFEVERPRRIVLLDNELDERMARRWLREHQIAHPDRVDVVPMRGHLSTFNILDAGVRTQWAEHLRCEGSEPDDVLIVDCLRPALDALGLSEDKDAGRFLEALDEFTREAGFGETLVVLHLGHSGERARGDSRIIDWPDATWRLVRDTRDDKDGPPGPTFFVAFGRDVDQPETQLNYYPAVRALTAVGGTRRQRRLDDVVEAIVEVLADASEALSGRQVEALLHGAGLGRDNIRDALRQAVKSGTVLIEEGPKNARLHYLNPAARGSARERAARTGEECASAPIGRTLAHSPSPGPVSEQLQLAHSDGAS